MHIHTTKLRHAPSRQKSATTSKNRVHPEAERECKNQRQRECIAHRVAGSIAELRNLQELLLSEDVDPRVLTDFRDALSRTRTTAWAVQQYLACSTTGADSAALMNILAAERIRVAYQLGQALAEELHRPNLKLQPGQLLELYKVMKDLTARLAELVG